MILSLLIYNISNSSYNIIKKLNERYYKYFINISIKKIQLTKKFLKKLSLQKSKYLTKNNL